MKILNDNSEEFVYVEIDDIDQGQFSIINHFKHPTIFRKRHWSKGEF